MKDPFRSTKSGSIVYLDNDKCQSPQLVTSKDNDCFMAYYNNKGKMTHAYKVYNNGMARSFSQAVDFDDAKSDKLSQKSFKEKETKKTLKNSGSEINTKLESKKLENSTTQSNANSLSSKDIKNALGQYDTKDLETNSSRANLIKELKAELENQSMAKNKALDILKKIKLGNLEKTN